MVSSMFGEEHPAILQYNNNLITCFSHQKENPEEGKKKCKDIIEKNIGIARKTFGETSIHLLFHLSSCLINKIAIGEVTQAAEATPIVKQMRLIINKFNGGDPRQLSNQLFFQV